MCVNHAVTTRGGYRTFRSKDDSFPADSFPVWGRFFPLIPFKNKAFNFSYSHIFRQNKKKRMSLAAQGPY